MKFKLVESTNVEKKEKNIQESQESVKVNITCKHNVITPKFTKDGILICPDSWEDGWRD